MAPKTSLDESLVFLYQCLHASGKLDYNAMANATGLSVAAVRMRLTRLRVKLEKNNLLAPDPAPGTVPQEQTLTPPKPVIGQKRKAAAITNIETDRAAINTVKTPVQQSPAKKRHTKGKHMTSPTDDANGDFDADAEAKPAPAKRPAQKAAPTRGKKKPVEQPRRRYILSSSEGDEEEEEEDDSEIEYARTPLAPGTIISFGGLTGGQLAYQPGGQSTAAILHFEVRSHVRELGPDDSVSNGDNNSSM